MQLFVTLDGEHLRLGAAGAGRRRSYSYALAAEPERIEMCWKAMRRLIGLAGASPAQAALFTARPRNEPRYVYRQPHELSDGWERRGRATRRG